MITKHGIKWINKDKSLQCPECNSNEVGYTIKSSIQRAGEFYTALCKCLSCECEFKIKREEYF